MTRNNLGGNLLATVLAVAFWAGLPAWALYQSGDVTVAIVWGIVIGLAVGSVLLAECGVRLPSLLQSFVNFVDRNSIHDCSGCKCGCGSPCQCKHYRRCK